MENDKPKLITTKTGMPVKTALFMLGFSIVLAVAVSILLATPKKAAIPPINVSLALFSGSGSLGSSQGITAKAGDPSTIFLYFQATASDPVVANQIAFSAASSASLFKKVKNWQLYQISDDGVLGSGTQTALGKVTASSQKVTANNLKLNLGVTPVTLLLKGDIAQDAPSGTIKVKVSGIAVKASLASQKKATIKKSLTSASGSLVTVNGVDKQSSLGALSPKAGSSWTIGSTMPITWNSKNYPADSFVSLLLMNRTTISGVAVEDVSSVIALNTSNDGSESWAIPSDVKPGSYFIAVSCGWGEDFAFGCTPGYSGSFTIK